MKILLVTNSAEIISSWRDLLVSCGHVLDVALSGAEAVERAVSGSPDIIVLDRIETPESVFTENLRRSLQNRVIPVVPLMSSDAPDPAAVLLRIKSMEVPRKVLVAEDDRQMANILKMLLEKYGYNVKTAFDGMETLKEIRDWKPQLVVLDVMLPVVDGFHICQTINEDHSFDPPPRVLIISGRSSDWDQNLGAACGAEYYLVKPFSNAVFLDKVREIMAATAGNSIMDTGE